MRARRSTTTKKGCLPGTPCLQGQGYSQAEGQMKETPVPAGLERRKEDYELLEF